MVDVMSLGDTVVWRSIETVFVCESDYLGHGVPHIIN